MATNEDDLLARVQSAEELETGTASPRGLHPIQAEYLRRARARQGGQFEAADELSTMQRLGGRFAAGVTDELTLGRGEMIGGLPGDVDDILNREGFDVSDMGMVAGRIFGAMPLAIASGGLANMGARALASRLGTRAPGIARALTTLSSQAPREAAVGNRILSNASRNVYEGLAYSAIAGPGRKIEEDQSRARTIAVEFGVGAAADFVLGAMFGSAGVAFDRVIDSFRSSGVDVDVEIAGLLEARVGEARRANAAGEPFAPPPAAGPAGPRQLEGGPEAVRGEPIGMEPETGPDFEVLAPELAAGPPEFQGAGRFVGDEGRSPTMRFADADPIPPSVQDQAADVAGLLPTETGGPRLAGGERLSPEEEAMRDIVGGSPFLSRPAPAEEAVEDVGAQLARLEARGLADDPRAEPFMERLAIRAEPGTGAPELEAPLARDAMPARGAGDEGVGALEASERPGSGADRRRSPRTNEDPEIAQGHLDAIRGQLRRADLPEEQIVRLKEAEQGILADLRRMRGEPAPDPLQMADPNEPRMRLVGDRGPPDPLAAPEAPAAAAAPARADMPASKSPKVRAVLQAVHGAETQAEVFTAASNLRDVQIRPDEAEAIQAFIQQRLREVQGAGGRAPEAPFAREAVEPPPPTPAREVAPAAAEPAPKAPALSDKLERLAQHHSAVSRDPIPDETDVMLLTRQMQDLKKSDNEARLQVLARSKEISEGFDRLTGLPKAPEPAPKAPAAAEPAPKAEATPPPEGHSVRLVDKSGEPVDFDLATLDSAIEVRGDARSDIMDPRGMEESGDPFDLQNVKQLMREDGLTFSDALNRVVTDADNVVVADNLADHFGLEAKWGPWVGNRQVFPEAPKPKTEPAPKAPAAEPATMAEAVDAPKAEEVGVGPDAKKKPQVLLGHSRSGKVIQRLEDNGWGRIEITAERVEANIGKVDPMSRTGIEGGGEQRPVRFEDSWEFRHPLEPYKGEPYAVDTGIYSQVTNHGPLEPADEDAFFGLWLKRAEELALRPEAEKPFMVVLPDVPFNGATSIQMSRKWLAKAPEGLPYYLPVQEGMTPEAVLGMLSVTKGGELVRGIFLGGGDKFKLAEAQLWSDFAHENGLLFHYGRAGTLSKLDHATEVGADSVDSAFPLFTIPRLDEFIAAWRGTHPREDQVKLLLTDAETSQPLPRPEDVVDPKLAEAEAIGAEVSQNLPAIKKPPEGLKTDDPKVEGLAQRIVENIRRGDPFRGSTVPATKKKADVIHAQLHDMILKAKKAIGQSRVDAAVIRAKSLMGEPGSSDHLGRGHPDQIPWGQLKIPKALADLGLKHNPVPTRHAFNSMEPDDLRPLSELVERVTEARVTTTDEMASDLARGEARHMEEMAWEKMDLQYGRELTDDIRARMGIDPLDLEPTLAEQATVRDKADASARAYTPGKAVKGVNGAETVVNTPAGPIRARYKVVELEDLIPSHDVTSWRPREDYFPEGAVQQRDYLGNPANRQSVEKIATSPRPAEFHDRSNFAQTGPPTITPDGKTVSGNGRGMAYQLMEIRNRKGLQEVRKNLQENVDDFGLSPSEVLAMKQPVLTRELLDIDPGNIDQLRELNIAFDESVGKAKSLVEDAGSRAARLEEVGGPAIAHLEETLDPDATLRAYLWTAAGRKFVKMLREGGIISTEEVGRFIDVDSGNLTEAGRDMVAETLLVRAVGNPKSVSRAPPAIKEKLEHIVPGIIRAQAGGKWDLSKALAEALDLHGQLQADPQFKGKKGRVWVFRNQQDMFGRQLTERVLDMAQSMEDSSKTDLTEMFRSYFREMDIALKQDQSEDLFAGTSFFEPKSPEKVFDEVFGAARRMDASKQKPCQ